MLETGNKAPDFSLPDQDGNTQTLDSVPSEWTLIYFYPKDDTPGCTKEACLITETYDDFEDLGVRVLGVSKDSPASHKKFAEKYNLPFTLLADETTEMIAAYQAWGEKSMFGKKYDGIMRVSYLLDAEHRIVKVYPKVDPANHAIEILADIRALCQ